MAFQNRAVRIATAKKIGQLFILFSIAVAGFADDDAADEGKMLYKAACTQCHGLAPIERTRDGRSGWEDTVEKMVVIGTQLDADEMEKVVDYLYRNFGPGSGDPMTTGVLPPDSPLQTDGTVSSDQVVLPEGEGKQLVQGLCTMCHDLGLVVATRRDADDWQRYAVNMLRQNGIKIPEENQKIIVSYLNQNFGRAEPN